MRNEQYLLVAVGLALMVLLGALPQVVVDTDGQKQGVNMASADEDTEEHRDSGEGFHQNEQYESLLPAIARFEGDFRDAASDKAQKTALDSLTTLFRVANMPDSAADFAGLYAEKQPSVANDFLAAELYYEAFSFALDAKKGEKLANKAKAFYNSYLMQKPDDEDAKVKLGVVMVSSDPAPMQGIFKIREVLEKNPENRLALMNLGLLAIRSGQHDKAVHRFEKLAELEPEQYEAFFYMGFCLKELGKNAEAIEALTKAKSKTDDPAASAAIDKYLAELSE